jgi:hypothetical protein
MMKTFKTVREAKEFLAGKIAEEAKREGTPLTEVERKMLYFTETGWTLQDIMDVNAEFERDYNEVENEQKIGGLVRRIQERQNSRDEEPREAWCTALETVGDEDCYLLTLIDAGCRTDNRKPLRWGRLGPWLPDLGSNGTRPPGDTGRLILVSMVVSAVLFVVLILWASIRR